MAGVNWDDVCDRVDGCDWEKRVNGLTGVNGRRDVNELKDGGCDTMMGGN